MGTSATRAKQKYNSINYEKITLTLSPILTENFKNLAIKNNLSQPKFLEEILNFWENNKKILDQKDNEIENHKNRIVQLEAIQKNYENWYNSLQNEKQEIQNSELQANNKLLAIQRDMAKTVFICLFAGFLIGFFFAKIF